MQMRWIYCLVHHARMWNGPEMEYSPLVMGAQTRRPIHPSQYAQRKSGRFVVVELFILHSIEALRLIGFECEYISFGASWHGLCLWQNASLRRLYKPHHPPLLPIHNRGGPENKLKLDCFFFVWWFIFSATD